MRRRQHHCLLPIFLLLVLFVCLDRVGGDGNHDGSNNSPRTLSAPRSSRPFSPVLDQNGNPGSIKYYQRENGDWAVRYYDPVGLVDLGPVPQHFRKLSQDRVVYELLYHSQTQGNWTERTTLEILYHALMEPPVRDDSIFRAAPGQPFNAKAAMKQQQRHHYFLTASRRTYQQYVRENAVAAATAHRAGSMTGFLQGGHSLSSLGVPVVTRKMDTAYGWLRDDIDICEWEGVVCGDFSATSQYYWNTAGIMTTLDDDNKYIQQEKWTCDHCPDLQLAKQHVTKLELPYAGLVGTLPAEVAMLRYLHRLDLRGNRLYGECLRLG